MKPDGPAYCIGKSGTLVIFSTIINVILSTVLMIGKIFNTGFHSTGFDVCIVYIITQFERID